MRHIKLKHIAAGSAFLLLISITASVSALPIQETVQSIADRLVSNQSKDTNSYGAWPYGPNQPDKIGFTGSIAAGLVGAYELTCDPNYKNSAEEAGYYIYWRSHPAFFYGDEAYALSCLSENSTLHVWHDSLYEFFYNIQIFMGGTEDYINHFMYTEPSTAVFYVANNTIAAYNVGASDKQIWRQGLIKLLSKVDDNTASYPVMALGVATWALAKTGSLDDTLIDPDNTGAPYWKDKTLKDLPSLLISHQVPQGLRGMGSFYWMFNHTPGDLKNNYTEDAIYAAMGLAAASKIPNNDPNLDPNVLDAAIYAARRSLYNGVDSDGNVYVKLSKNGALLNVYAGEMLQAIRELNIPGDINLDGQVDTSDLDILNENLGVTGCDQQSCWCNGADINRDGKVNDDDMLILLDHWLEGMPPK